MSDDGDPLWGLSLARRKRLEYWRSLAEQEGSARPGASTEAAAPEAAELREGHSRRDFMKLLGAGMALAGVGACAKSPPRKILPYADQPVAVTPGVATYYATSMAVDGYAVGLLVESHEGRPTKVEGNPRHPASLGAAGVREQASVLGLYDPGRARAPRRDGSDASWVRFLAEHGAPRADHGARLRFLLEPTASPLLGSLIARVRARHPEARFVFHSAAGSHNTDEGTRLVFGRPLQLHYDFGAATTLLALDSDFLFQGPFALRYARQLAARRRIDVPSDGMNRLYSVETRLSVTGSMADHRLRRRAVEIPAVLSAVAAELAGLGVAIPGLGGDGAALLARLRGGEGSAWAAPVARDLRRSAGASIVLAGERQAAWVHALALLVNAALGNLGRTVYTTEPTLVDAGPATLDLAGLAAEMDRSTVETLVLLERNPSYDAPADLDFARRLRAVPQSVCLGLHPDETALDCKWFLPAAHYLEAWGDARAWDGTVSTVQPLMDPLYGGRTPAEVLAVFAGEPHPDGHRLLVDHWRTAMGLGHAAFAQALQHGLLEGSAAPRVDADVKPDGALAMLGRTSPPPTASGGALELDFHLDPNLYDGRYANNPWLLELGEPITKLTWDNAALLSPATARRLHLATGDRIEIAAAGRRLATPVLVIPGHADEAVSLHLGWGHRAPGLLSTDLGVDAYALRRSDHLHFLSGVTLRTLEGHYDLAQTQGHFRMEGRPIALRTTLDAYRAAPDVAKDQRGPVPTLFPDVSYTGMQWAMSIDMSICTGCSACVVACQAENNVPTVGKEGVCKSREMHWLRIDTYYTGDPDDPGVVHQPMLCQHCEKAPCEYVCPVNATVHSPDGLNEMVYNRCVGTRFCSNNCPYKVRRFNWFNWYKEVPVNRGPVKLQRNPEVTVRERGVMEKCTFCVQRIRETEIAASRQGRAIRPGEVTTACQQACPTRAIQFDSLSHPDTEMMRWRRQPRAYEVLHDLGTRPRVLYLARVDNPNPELK